MGRNRQHEHDQIPKYVTKSKGFWVYRPWNSSEKKFDKQITLGRLSDSIDVILAEYQKYVERPFILKPKTEIISDAISYDKDNCGIYFLIKDGEIIYIGKSVNIISRVVNHRHTGMDFDSFSITPLHQSMLNIAEKVYIKIYKPKFNSINYFNYHESEVIKQVKKMRLSKEDEQNTIDMLFKEINNSD